MVQSSHLRLFKGIALFTPGGDVIYCIDPEKRGHWHHHLCLTLQDLLKLPEPPHFLVPCYTATLDKSLNSHHQIVVFAEAHPLVYPYQAVLNAIFQSFDTVWQPINVSKDTCDPVVIATYRHRFPSLWENHDLIVQVGQRGWKKYSTWYGETNMKSNNSLSVEKDSLHWSKPPQKALLLNDPGITIVPEKVQPESNPLISKGYVLRLFISGHDPSTEQTLQNLYQILERVLSHPYTLKVIDVSKHPELAEANHVAATPTLVKVWPLPIRKIVGKLENPNQVLQLLTYEPEMKTV